MITILWLIRSSQGMIRKDDVTPWQDDWFLTVMLAFLCFLLDATILAFVIGFISLL